MNDSNLTNNRKLRLEGNNEGADEGDDEILFFCHSGQLKRGLIEKRNRGTL